MGTAHTRAYRGGVLEAEGFPMGEVSERLGESDTVVWIDLCAPSAAELHELAAELGLHELAVENALDPHQRPKLDLYPTHAFLACHAIRFDSGAERLVTTEIDAFVNDRWLVTVRANEEFPIGEVTNRWDGATDMTRHGVGFLLYSLLDTVIDAYFDVLADFDDYYDEVSDLIFAGTPLSPEQQRRWFHVRQSLVRFHRLAAPLREVVSGLLRREHTTVHEELYPYYQDLYDHILRVVESTDALRDLVTTIVETNLTLHEYRQNLIMKKVTSWAAIIAVPTLITGYYGMNVPYPGEGRTAGWLVSVGLIVVCAAALYALFRRKGWL
ncbi:MAG: magnesium transporter CorA family protein [Acidimicrobiia bacterium]|nr:magnesium transporter CorA family protein [Acidimicrobiia bacterium]